jgi:uncharacterized membrane protein
MLILSAILLQVLIAFIDQGYSQARPVSIGVNYWITIFYVALDLLVICVVATFLAVISKTPGFVLIGTLGFTLVARSFSSILALLGGSRVVVDGQEQYQESLSFVSFLIPDLGSLDVREITLYDDISFLPSNLNLVVLSVVFYVIAMSALTSWVVNRRRFA